MFAQLKESCLCPPFVVLQVGWQTMNEQECHQMLPSSRYVKLTTQALSCKLYTVCRLFIAGTSPNISPLKDRKLVAL